MFCHGQWHNEHALTFGLEDRVSTSAVLQASVSRVVYFGLPCGTNAAHVTCREQDASTQLHLVLRPAQQGLYSWLSLSSTMAGTLSQELQSQSWGSGGLSWVPAPPLTHYGILHRRPSLLSLRLLSVQWKQ